MAMRSGLLLIAAACVAGLRWTDMTAQFGARPASPNIPEPQAVSRRQAGRKLVVRYRGYGRTPADARRSLHTGTYRALVRDLVQPISRLRSEVDRLTAALAAQRQITVREAGVGAAARTATSAHGRYAAEGEVEVDRDAFVADFCGSASSNLRLLVVLDDSGPEGKSIVQTALERELEDGGFEVFDWSVATRQGDLGKMAQQLAAAQGDARAANRLGARYLSSLFVRATVRGSARRVSDEAAVYTARADVRVIRAEDGRVLLSESYDASGAGIDADRAREKALATLGHSAAIDLPDRLKERLPESRVNLTIRGVPPERRAALLASVQGLKGVSDVTSEVTGEGAQDGVILRFNSREKPYALVARLEGQESLTVQTIRP